VIQDVLTIHGAQFKDAALIVASPPCQAYSYRAMPWKKAKALLPPDNSLFEACFRIQREACEAAGRYVPMVVENVRGAQKWVGRARWNYGSYYLWGDVPALMPMTFKGTKVPGFRFDGSGKSFQTASVDGIKVPGMNWHNHGKPGYRGKAFNSLAVAQLRDDIKNTGGSWFGIAHNATSGKSRNPDGRNGVGNDPRRAGDHVKMGGDWFGPNDVVRRGSSGSTARKFASAQIAKIPLPLARHIARSWRPLCSS
jgi:hypothetical protein